MKRLLCLVLPFLIALPFSSCRYKDNDKLSLLTAKKRLERTWQLKEGIKNGFDLTPTFRNENLTISNVTKKSISMRVDQGRGFSYDFTNKTTIYFTDGTSKFSLRITKLTNKELWMEGSGLANILLSSITDDIKVKYDAK